MLGLYLAIIAVYLWAVLVFAHSRHMRVAIILPIVLIVGLPLMVLHQVFKFLEEYWGGFWIYFIDLTDKWSEDFVGSVVFAPHRRNP